MRDPASANLNSCIVVYQRLGLDQLNLRCPEYRKDVLPKDNDLTMKELLEKELNFDDVHGLLGRFHSLGLTK